MKNKCALLICALTIISALLIIKPYNVSADVLQSDYQSYLDTINGCTDSGTDFFWKNSSFSNSGYSFDSVDRSFFVPSYYMWTGSYGIVSGSYSTHEFYANTGIVNFNIVSDGSYYDLVLSDSSPYMAWSGLIWSFSANQNGISGRTANSGSTIWSNGTIINDQSLSYIFNFLTRTVRNANIFFNGVAWSYSPGYDIPISYGIMNTNKGLKVNGADFSFYTSYTDNKFTVAYNYSLTNRDSSDSSLRIEAGDLLTFELYAKVPTKEFVDHYISENGLGDATPSIMIDVARNLKNTTNIINTSSIPTTTIYGINYYGYNQDDAVEYDDSYYNYQYGNDQNGILTFRVTSDNNSADSPNLLAQLVKYYGSEREAIIGSAMGYIDYCRSYVVNVTDNNWNVYNPYYTYFFQVKDESGRNVIRANSFEGTPQQFNPNDVENGESVGDVYAPSTNQSDIENSYTGGITNSYNSVVNNYYNTSEANQELLDYLYRYRDGGQQEDIQNAYGYLNSTIDSVSNVPVVIGKLFYGFFPPQVILLFNAMFIIFAVFIIIKIIRHLFL